VQLYVCNAVNLDRIRVETDVCVLPCLALPCLALSYCTYLPALRDCVFLCGYAYLHRGTEVRFLGGVGEEGGRKGEVSK